jgi:NAD(P)-dependent dehydrogenase (short-subunit alcohol dehydrogenase family)
MRNTNSRAALDAASKEAGVEANIVVEQLDVSQDNSVDACFKKIVAAESRIDVLVNNAGYSLFGTVEMVTLEQSHEQFETNFFGVVRCQKAVLPVMRAQKSGKIINTSSVGGVYGQAFNDLYCASKFALEGLAESQAALFRTFGVYVTNVEPGAIRTEFISNAKRPDPSTIPEEYQAPLKNVLAVYAKGFANPATSQDGDDVAQVIIDKVINVATPPLRVQTNESTMPIFKALLVDTTGETSVMITQNRFLSSSE